ncbi:MAG: AmmeMemoRadiSam system protein B [Planctomycetes bacterium]|nr:AmmeMemoRadiSam system protein B [Planctomycetota bacterium]
MSLRPARFAGSWYPSDPDRLRADLAGTAALPTAAPARALILPHAGYRFSLGVAAPALAQVTIPQTVVVLCPNHTVPPPIVAAWPSGSWETPLGSVEIDAERTAALLRACPWVVAQEDAHLREHAIELILPLLQARRADLRLIALVVAESRYERLEALGEALAGVLADDPDALLIASTDMSHFLDADEARRRDERALERLLAFDPAGLLDRCEAEEITMCGVRPTAAVLVAARARGARKVELVRYSHSGEVSGDTERVVGYASCVVR